MVSKKASKSTKVTHPLRVGASVFIRTLSMYYTGRIVTIDAGSILLEDAAWIADTGRFGKALESGSFSEIEPYPGPVAINSGHVLDITEWNNELPRKAKP